MREEARGGTQQAFSLRRLVIAACGPIFAAVAVCVFESAGARQPRPFSFGRAGHPMPPCPMYSGEACLVSAPAGQALAGGGSGATHQSRAQGHRVAAGRFRLQQGRGLQLFRAQKFVVRSRPVVRTRHMRELAFFIARRVVTRQVMPERASTV